MAAKKLLPTPRTTDANGAGAHGTGGMDLRTAAGEQWGIGEVEVDWGDYEPAIRAWEEVMGREAPAPTEPNRNGNPRLNAAFSEWMMGLDAGWVTDAPIPYGAKLKILGNGNVPQQQTQALRILFKEELWTE